MKFSDLAPSQRAVVDASEQLIVAIGGPGCGKTSAALWAASAELEKIQTKPWQRVLFLTFSRTAVSQLQQRSAGIFRGKNASRIDVLTFDAFAHQMLGAWGRYAGHGQKLADIQSEAQKLLFGESTNSLAYEDLVPGAIELLESVEIERLVAGRWPLVICDEFQDTDDTKLKLLWRLHGAGARLVVLADPNQMIYQWLGVNPKRLEQIKERADRVVVFEEKSHREPSGTIPAMAAAILRREFDSEAVQVAIDRQMLRVVPNVTASDLMSVIEQEMTLAEGCKSIAIFGRSNPGVARLSAELDGKNIDHAIIGLSEAEGEGLLALLTICLFAVGGLGAEDLRRALGTFYQASVRGGANAEARALAGLATMNGDARWQAIQTRLELAEREIGERQFSSVGELVQYAGSLWPFLDVGIGNRVWKRVHADFTRLARPIETRIVSLANVRLLERTTRDRRVGAFLDLGKRWPDGLVQIMNFAQTKGREADLVMLLFRQSDGLGPRRGPFDELSRSLYVALTRARKRAVVILPPEPHPFISPFQYLPQAD